MTCFDTWFYYVQSRYYDPAIGRFINADAFASTGQGLLGNNMFAYCNNNPITRMDPDGEAWETAFDVVSFAASASDFIANPNLWTFACVSGDFIDMLIPFVGGLGETVHIAKVVKEVAETADDIHDVKKSIDTLEAAAKVHGNSLSTTKPAVGYALRSIDTNDIMKYGETTRGTKRYTNKFYRENNVYMDILASGSKREMHTWQHQKITDYFNAYGILPPMNKSFW